MNYLIDSLKKPKFYLAILLLVILNFAFLYLLDFKWWAITLAVLFDLFELNGWWHHGEIGGIL